MTLSLQKIQFISLRTIDIAESLIATANNFYLSVPGEWVCIELDLSVLGDTVVYEAPAPVGSIASNHAGSEIKFPHIYGGISERSILHYYPMKRSADGTFEGIVGLTILS